uniref:Uncharacterized protein n=1 Tax=Panagrellus redivivus TaxID=6233 RepID=A0A7E4VNK7_PANRE
MVSATFLDNEINNDACLFSDAFMVINRLCLFSSNSSIVNLRDSHATFDAMRSLFICAGFNLASKQCEVVITQASNMFIHSLIRFSQAPPGDIRSEFAQPTDGNLFL